MYKKLYIFVGPPGSGKGTQADMLIKPLNLNYFSVGEILRQEIANKTTLGKQVKSYVKEGLLVPDELIASLMIDKLAKSRKSLIFDGFPRNIKQAELLNKALLELALPAIVVQIQLPSKKIFERIAGRRYCVCGKTYHIKFNPPKQRGLCDRCGKKLKIRADAKSEVVHQRIAIYNRKTKPVLKVYAKNDNCTMINLDGDRSILDVHRDLKQQLKNLL